MNTESHFKLLLDYLYKASKYFVFILLAGMVLCIFLQVVFRYVFNSPLFWSEELGRILFIWMCLIGSSMATRKMEQMTIDIFVKKLPQRIRLFFEIISWGLVCIFVLFVIVYGLEFVLMAKKQIRPGTGIPASVLYLCIPIGFSLMFLYTIEIMVNAFKKSD